MEPDVDWMDGGPRNEGDGVTTLTAPQATVGQVMADLAALEDPKIRAVNERHGDDHGVNLTKLRAVATRLKTQHELAGQLWETERHGRRGSSRS